MTIPDLKDHLHSIEMNQRSQRHNLRTNRIVKAEGETLTAVKQLKEVLEQDRSQLSCIECLLRSTAQNF